jgi:tetratricopeptide (TPR) repeat protein
MEYAFLHVLLRDVAYGQIPRADRAAKHLAAARWIESLGRREDHAEMLAHHYGSALELMRAGGVEAAAEVRSRACVAFADAGERALALSAAAAAAQFLESAIELAGERPPKERALLQYWHTVALFRMGDECRVAALEDARDSLLGVGDCDRAAEVESLLAEVYWYRGSLDRCHEHLRRAEAFVSEAAPTREKARVLAQIARFRMLADEDEDALRVAHLALALVEELGLEELLPEVLTTIGTMKANSGDITGADDLERAIELTAGRASTTTWRAVNNLAFVVTHRFGDVRRAQQLVEDGLQLAERAGDRDQIIWFSGQLALGAHHLGELDEALCLADGVIAAAESGFATRVEIATRAYRARIRLARNDMAGAAADGERAIELAQTLEAQAAHATLAVSAFVLCGLGRRAEAEAVVNELAKAFRTGGVGGGTPSALPVFAAVLVELGRATEFAEYAARVPRPSPWVPAAEAYAAGEYERAADLCAELSLPDEAHARMRAAEQLAREGRRAEADGQLQRALAFWRSVGATRYVREGEALLAATA